MNIGQQVGLAVLFSKINKSLQKNPNSTISEGDLNKLRAYVIRSQRPLQAVKLLEKEKEAREADYKFNKQKEEIIGITIGSSGAMMSKAQRLEKEKAEFKRNQTEMIKRVKDSMETIVKNATKRKMEEQKRIKEENDIKLKKERIQELK